MWMSELKQKRKKEEKLIHFTGAGEKQFHRCENSENLRFVKIWEWGFISRLKEIFKILNSVF